MENQKMGLSLRYKLLILLTILPVISLSLYLLMATQLFEKDKIAYVFDSSVAVSRSLATQVRVEVDSLLGKVKPVVENYDFAQGRFSQLSQDLFLKQDRIDAVYLFQGSAGGRHSPLGDLQKDPQVGSQVLRDTTLVQDLTAKAFHKGLVVQRYEPTGKHILVATRLGEKDDPRHLIVLSLYRADDLLEAFAQSSLYQSFLLDEIGQVAIGPTDLSETPLAQEKFTDFFSPILGSKTPEGTAEVLTREQRPTLVSYSEAAIGDMIVASVVDKEDALRAVTILVSKSLLFFVALISSTVIISVFASVRLTSTLRELYEGTRKIAQGQFDVRVQSRSRDEVGGLAESFNWMAGEVSRLLSATAEKARMENELATVKTVQETLFPASSSQFGPFQIVGHFEPASECGGDWWSYSQVGSRVFLWIGDATGHGAPAALITSAARSAAAIVESLPDMSPSRALEIMNKAIHETSKGKIMMTFFLGMLDLETGELTYANASHDPPYLIRPKDRPLSKRDLLPLMDVNGSRLGDKKDSTYEETTVKLEPGDTLLFYTDGIMDVQNNEGAAYGERAFIRSLVKSVAEGRSVDEKLNNLKGDISQFREGSDLIDDVTMFMCHYARVG